jgi:hypothetical protein
MKIVREPHVCDLRYESEVPTLKVLVCMPMISYLVVPNRSDRGVVCEAGQGGALVGNIDW